MQVVNPNYLPLVKIAGTDLYREVTRHLILCKNSSLNAMVVLGQLNEAQQATAWDSPVHVELLQPLSVVDAVWASSKGLLCLGNNLPVNGSKAIDVVNLLTKSDAIPTSSSAQVEPAVSPAVLTIPKMRRPLRSGEESFHQFLENTFSHFVTVYPDCCENDYLNLLVTTIRQRQQVMDWQPADGVAEHE